MVMTVKTEGFAEMEALLFTLKSATGKNTVVRAQRKALQQTAELAANMAPKKTGELAEGIIISRRTKPKEKARSDVEIYVGPRRGIMHALPQETGTVDHGPHPYMRPAWDATKYSVLSDFGELLWVEIEKSIQRQARKAAREAAKMKR